MAWAHVQDSPGSGGVASASASSVNIGAFGSAVTINNFIVVWTWGGNTTSPPTAGQVTCSDNGSTPNTYTQIAFQGLASVDCFFAIFVATNTHNPSSGNLNPKVSVAGAGQFVVGCAAEFSGGTTTLDGSAVTSSHNNNPSATNPSTGNYTSSVSNDLLVYGFGLDQGTNLTSITDPTGTKVGETTSESVMAGSGMYQIVSGQVTNNNPTWTVSGMANSGTCGWCAGQVALQVASGGATQLFEPAWAVNHGKLIRQGLFYPFKHEIEETERFLRMVDPRKRNKRRRRKKVA